MTPEEFRFAIDDARRRQAAIVDLIASNDRQALSFLQLYVALAGGALSGAAAILLPASPSFPQPLGAGLFGFALPLAIGAMLCMRAVWPSRINLPGRGAKFWLWAKDVPPEQAYVAYLSNLDDKDEQNSNLNRRLSRYMMFAKILGVAAPITGFLFGAATYLVR